MFVVRRAFRGPHGILSAGSVIEPADIKDFRYRFRERHVIEVNEQNFERYKEYFKTRYGAALQDLPVDKAKAEAEEKAKAEAEEKAKAEAEEKAKAEAKKEPVKPVAKVAKAVATNTK